MINILTWIGADRVTVKEKFFSGIATGIAILLVMIISHSVVDYFGVMFVAASMGSSAVLLYAVPQGPLSQPWPFLGGHWVSAVIGISCVKFIPDITWAAAVAVGLAVFFMYLLRCLHPPGGATALTVVVGGDSIVQLGYQYIWMPLTVNMLIMLLWALWINNVLPGRHYPNQWKRFATKNKANQSKVGLQALLIEEDLKYVLEHIDNYLDVSEQELQNIIYLASVSAWQRKIGDITCQDIMTKPVISGYYETEVETLWLLMKQHKLRSVPIVDRQQKVVGIVTAANFFRHVECCEEKGVIESLQHFLQHTPGLHTEKPEYAGHLMTTPVVSIQANSPASELFRLFYEKGVHHIPVVDAAYRLQGMITPRDFFALLSRSRLSRNNLTDKA